MGSLKELNIISEKGSFNTYSTTAKLEALALHPVDLTDPHVLTPERIKKYAAEACGYHLLFATEKVDDEVISALHHLAEESQALEKMKHMQDGEVMNFIEGFSSENRPVLHTALRDFFSHPKTTRKASEAAKVARQEIEKLQVFIEDLDKKRKYDEMVVIGIGGSDLGPRAHYYALESLLKPHRKVSFISNVDPDDAASVMKNVADLERTLVVVISKSGTTLETATNEALVRERFVSKGLNSTEHFISITMPRTPMDSTEKYFKTFYLWDWVGGRFCTTSICGSLIIAFSFGMEVLLEFLRGAHEMDLAALQKDLKRNLPLLAALIGIWNHNFLHYPTLAIIPYSQALHRFPAHIQQLDMESNGKLIDQKARLVNFQTGPILWGEPGTNAQHSFFQLIHQGTAVVPVCMIGYKESQYHEDLVIEGTTSQEKLLGNLFAQSIALAMGQRSDNPGKYFPGNRPSHVLIAEQLTPYTLGALLAFFEHKVAFQGFIWGINSFDQEGVQLGKILANKIIDRFAAKRKGQSDRAPFAIGDAYLHFLDQLN